MSRKILSIMLITFICFTVFSYDIVFAATVAGGSGR